MASTFTWVLIGAGAFIGFKILSRRNLEGVSVGAGGSSGTEWDPAYVSNGDSGYPKNVAPSMPAFVIPSRTSVQITGSSSEVAGSPTPTGTQGAPSRETNPNIKVRDHRYR